MIEKFIIDQVFKLKMILTFRKIRKNLTVDIQCFITPALFIVKLIGLQFFLVNNHNAFWQSNIVGIIYRNIFYTIRNDVNRVSVVKMSGKCFVLKVASFISKSSYSVNLLVIIILILFEKGGFTVKNPIRLGKPFF